MARGNRDEDERYRFGNKGLGFRKDGQYKLKNMGNTG